MFDSISRKAGGKTLAAGCGAFPVLRLRSAIQCDFMGARQSASQAPTAAPQHAMNDYCLYYVMALQIKTFVVTHFQQLVVR